MNTTELIRILDPDNVKCIICHRITTKQNAEKDVWGFRGYSCKDIGPCIKIAGFGNDMEEMANDRQKRRTNK